MPTAAEVERTIRRVAADMGASDLANLLVAISKRESGLGQNNVGDNGDSIGPFQENVNGRGRGLSREARMDPVASTKRAIAEIRTVQRANPNADPGTIAILAQRPAESLRANYRADINAQVTRLGNSPQAEDGTRPVRAASTAGRRPPSAQAQLAQQRAISSVRGTPQSPASTAGQQRAMNLAFKGTYVMPVDGQVTNPYGGKQTYSEGKSSNIGSFNNGADIGAKAGTPVRAPVGGVVKSVYNAKNDDRAGKRDAEENSGWGGQVVIQGDDGKEHRLSHAQFGSIVVKPGQRVEAGQATHKVGMTGNATGPHVDWEKWTGGKSEDPLKAPLVPAAAGAQAYAQAMARMREQDQAQAQAAPAETPAAAPAATGATNVPDTSPLISHYQTRQQEIDAAIAAKQAEIDAYRNELIGTSAGPAGPVGPIGQTEGRPVQGLDKTNPQRFDQLTREKGLIQTAEQEIRDLQQERSETGAKLAQAQVVAQKETLNPEEKAQFEAKTEQIRLQNEQLRREIAGTVDPLKKQQIQSQIAATEAEIAARDRSLNIQARQTELEAARNPSAIRAAEAGAARSEWEVAEASAMLPYNIDRVLASTDVDTETANRLRELLPAEVEKAWTEIWRLQELTPVEIQQGRANVDLTRQRSNEIARMIGPNIQKILASVNLDTANTARILQSLPLELADLGAQTQLRNAQRGLTEAQTGQVSQETRLTQYQADAEAERQRRWQGIEERIRANPNMSQQELDQLVLGSANSIQEWSTAYRTQLERQVAQSEQHLATQRNQMTQQTSDSEVRNQRETEAVNWTNARTNQTNAFTSSLQPGQQGPMRRMSQLAAAAPLVGTEGLRDVAMANRIGQMDLGPIQAGWKKFEEMVGGIRASAPDVRMAPDVTAPPPIDIRFTPPTAGMPASPLGTSTGAGSTATSTAAVMAPTTAPINPFSPPTFSDEEKRRLGMSRGRIGGV